MNGLSDYQKAMYRKRLGDLQKARYDLGEMNVGGAGFLKDLYADEINKVQRLLGMRQRRYRPQAMAGQTMPDELPPLLRRAALDEAEINPEAISFAEPTGDITFDIPLEEIKIDDVGVDEGLLADAIAQAEPEQKPRAGLLSRMRSGLTGEGGILSGSPSAQAQLRALGSSLLTGPSRVPVSFGQTVGQAFSAMEAAKAAQSKAELTELATKSEKSKLEAEEDFKEAIAANDAEGMAKALAVIDPVGYRKALMDKKSLGEMTADYVRGLPESEQNEILRKLAYGGGNIIEAFLGFGGTGVNDKNERKDLSSLTNEELEKIAEGK